VKARATERYGPAASAVDWRKQRRLRHAASEWLVQRVGVAVAIRFDVVAITGNRVDVVHDAF
jgi:Holliday junction resolvase-like predicted endonuclease